MPNPLMSIPLLPTPLTPTPLTPNPLTPNPPHQYSMVVKNTGMRRRTIFTSSTWGRQEDAHEERVDMRKQNLCVTEHTKNNNIFRVRTPQVCPCSAR